MMFLLGTNDYTEALMYILVDWEKTRYLVEQRRLLELAEIRFALLQHVNNNPIKQKT